MKFQDSGFNGSKVTVGTIKCDARMHAQWLYAGIITAL